MIRTSLRKLTTWAAAAARLRRSTRPKVSRFRPNLEHCEERTLLDTKIWTGAVNENWSNAGNWNGGLPGAEDIALFNNTATRFTANVDAAFAGTLAGLSIQSSWGGTISLNRSLSVTGGMTLAGGSFGGNGALTLGGASVWSGGSVGIGTGGWTNNGTLTFSIGGQINLGGVGTLTNNGTILHTGGNLAFFGVTLTNTATGVYEFRSDSALFNNGTVNNAGTIRKTTTAGTSAIQTTFNSSGALDVQRGTLALGSGAASLTGGTFTVAQDAVLDLTNGGTVTYSGMYSGSGDGTVALRSGILVIGANDTTFNFAGRLFQWTAGNLALNGRTLINAAATGVINVSGDAQKNLGGPGTLTNHGAIVHRDAGSIALFDGAVLNNTATGTYEVRGGPGNNAVFNNGGVTNAGTIHKTAGTGTFFIQTSFSNSGNINVQAGTVTLANASGISTGGTFTVAQDAVLDLTGGNTVLYMGTYRGTGGGTVRLQNGTLAIGAAGATFDFAAGLFQWTGGSLGLTGSLTNAADSVLTLAGAAQKNLSGSSPLINQGTILHTGGNLAFFNDIVLNNTATGTYDLRGGAGDNALFNAGSVTNAGLFRKSAGAGAGHVDVPLNNTGTVEAGAGTLLLRNSVTQISGSTLTGGSWMALANATLHITTAGNLTASNANVTLNGVGSNFVNLASLAVNGGTFTVTGGRTFTTAGNLTNNGTLEIGAGSALTVTGNLTNFSGTTLTGGTYRIAGTFKFTNADIRTNAAVIELDGFESRILDQADQDAFNNLRRNAATGRLSIQNGRDFLALDLANDGQFSIGAGSSFLLYFGGTNNGDFSGEGNFLAVLGALYSSGTYNVGGLTQVFEGASVNFLADATTGSVDNTGHVGLFAGLTVTGDYVQGAGGTTELFFGTLTAASVSIGLNSFLIGVGTINGGVTNAGTIDVGYAGFASFLVINGDFTQTASGVVNLELGRIADGEYDLFGVNGTATLEGTINISLLSTFAAAADESIGVLFFYARGEGDPTINLPDLGPDAYLEPVLDEFSLSIVMRRR